MRSQDPFTLTEQSSKPLNDLVDTAHQALGEAAGSFWAWRPKSDKLSVVGTLISLLDQGQNGPLSLETLIQHTAAEDRGGLRDGIIDLLETGKALSIEHKLQTEDGMKWFRTEARLSEEGPEASLILGITRNVHDDVDSRISAEEAKRSSEQANRLKTEFLTNISHELRTPLNGVLGMAQLLERSSLDRDQVRFVQKLKASGNALLSIIDDVLDISRIEAGRVKLDSEPFTFPEIVTEARDAAAGLAAQKSLKLRTDIDERLEGVTFRGDRKRILQVTLNLAGNAVKFTDRGSVCIGVRRTAKGARVFITDTGPGIERDQQDLIFARFSQADSSSTRKHGGTGLGLAISKELIELMNGTIGVESEVGLGSRFFFELPLRPDQSRQRTRHEVEAAPPEAKLSPCTPIHVLLAEDNLVNQEVIQDMVSLCANVKLTIVEHGEAALAAVQEAPFDLVFMDINMPFMTGDEAIKKIRALDGPVARIPIFVLSANALKDARQSFLEIGADGYLSKPLNVDQVVETIERYRPRWGTSSVA